MDIKLEIIKLVEKYDCLYNAQSPQNKNWEYKQYLWDEIGKKVGISGTSAKREFKTVRDLYKKWQNKRLTEYGFQKQYKYAEHLRFLDDHMIFRGLPMKTSAFIQDEEEVNSDASREFDIFQKSTDLRSKIIDRVKQYDCFYNIHSPHYNNFEYKQQLWNQFEEELNMPAEQIESTWINLRDCYNKYKQNMDGKYKYAEDLKFLDEYTTPEREPASNETFIISFIDDDDGLTAETPNNLDLLEELKTDINVKIIEAVQNYDCLYDVNSPQSKNIEYRKVLWEHIGSEVGTSAEMAKRRWKSIKDYYRKCKLETGTKYKYSDYLTFLDDYMPLDRKPLVESTPFVDEEMTNESSNDAEILDINLRIIEAVKKHGCLYDEQSPQYKSFQYKQELWSVIGDKMNMPANAVRKKWQCFKDYYIKYKQNRMKSYKYAEYLEFLDDFISQQSYMERSTDLHLKIIEEVKNHKCLYDTQSIRYKDYEYRQEIWCEIGNKLGISVQNIKGKWKHVKDYYKRCKLTPNANYKYAKSLKFLDDYLDMESSSNIFSKGTNESISPAYEQKTPEFTNSTDVTNTYTEDINVNLIESVKKHECLYNEQSPKYKDITYKQKLWNEIGEEVGRSKKYVKKKWYNIMCRYKKCRERMLEERGPIQPYKYMENLKFLDDVFQRGNQKSYQLLDESEVNTDLSSDDSDVLYVPPVKKKKIDFKNCLKETQDILEKPISSKNLNKFGNSRSTKNQCLENLTLKKPLSIKKEGSITISDESQWFEKVNFENSLNEMDNCAEESISKNNLRITANPDSSMAENTVSVKKENTNSASSQRFEEENCEKRLEAKEEEPISINNLHKLENPRNSTSQWFELLAKKINESNLTADQQNEIEFAVSSIVYSKLAEFSKHS